MQREKRTIGVCLVSQDEELTRDLQAVLGGVNDLLDGNPGTPFDTSPDGECFPYRQLLGQAGRYLRSFRRDPALGLALRRFDSVADARQDVAIAGRASSPVECVLLDTRHEEPDGTDDPFTSLTQGHAQARVSPCSAMLLCKEEALGKWMCQLGGNRLVRVPHANPWQRRADLLRLILDHLEHAHFNRMLVRAKQKPDSRVTLARHIHQQMSERWGNRWDFHFYTGSMVASFIDSMKVLLQGTDNRCLTGNNEHSLAVSALAGWQLYGRAYVIAMTSGMIDEARGTLANLKRAGAPGIIVCADSPETVWYPFQGTLDADGNGHAVLAARGLWHGFMRTPDDMPACLQGAFQALDERPAPTFMLGTQNVLESHGEIHASVARPPAVHPAALSAAQYERLEQAVAVINHDDARVLWHCGRLTDDERERVLRMAEKAGIALADSIIHPGSVPAFHEGRPVENYLGPLSMYGFNRAVHEFLEMQDDDAQGAPWLFFLKGKVEQSATPYSEGKLKRNFRIAQVNRNQAHLSPFTRLALDLRLADFLDYLEPRLRVDDALLQRRRARLERLRKLPAALPSDLIETLPMTPNYFFQRLGTLVADLIETRGYRYTGVYDVGRCGLSALRNVARTDPGFSGWYGRALMGDGLMSLPYIALKNQRHVLAFIGDGARAIVPNVEQRVVCSALRGVAGRGGNVSVFYLSNGVLSMIQTYLDKRHTLNGSHQVNVPLTEWKDESVERVAAGVTVQRRVLRHFCPEQLGEALMAPGRVNFFDVWLGHNSEGDGLSLISEASWSRLHIQ
ncbi:decarboxylase [Stutzerimonas kirkiae]|uniref:decarboxylase n=1 Tax=Stutzerimonas kirkiae TaxID=2211392 RepID=UPI001038442C|nr:decarboxylase [Stutzerimonas kirkiae]TBV16651.1 decarboxylase [Stutzerimonas kirkiae]